MAGGEGHEADTAGGTRAATHRRQLGYSLEEAVAELSRVLRGWAAYFLHTETWRHFRRLEDYVHQALALWHNRQRQRQGRRWHHYGQAWFHSLGIYRPTEALRRLERPA